VPASVSVLQRDTLQNAGLQVNLSESLQRVPGVSVLNRQNHAQDLQLSIRGFGARSTFGIRGVRLLVDGIPATMPDGQGQASAIALSSIGRIEVLRGPLAQLYGNAAGGVVQLFTQADALQPTFTASTGMGPNHQLRTGLIYSTTTPGYGLTVDVSRFDTRGQREHSGAQRGQLNARLRTTLAEHTRVSLVFNAMDMPRAEDPLGLTRAQWEVDPTQTASPAFTQDARKSVRQQQLGAVIDHPLGEFTELSVRLHAGQRQLDNALSLPASAQTAPTSSGGIVEFSRTYAGLGTQLNHRITLAPGRQLRLTGGLEFDHLREDRQGYLNNSGSAGDLKRDELNQVQNRDVFVQASLDLHTAWTLLAGVRHSEVEFRSHDRFIRPGNPDDSGSVSYRATNPVAGLTWHATPDLNVYANLGRGFETPTFTELAYRPTGTGLNTALAASHARHLELGAKWRPDIRHRVEAAVFDIRTADEIVVDTNNGGRSTFKNAGRTQRRGLEFAYNGEFTDTLRGTLSLTAMRARFLDGFQSGTAPVAAGNRLPGTPERNAFADLAWSPRSVPGRLQAAVELVHTGSLMTNDVNDDAAPAVTVLNLRAGTSQQWEGWTLSQLLRLENATDRRYAGSVIVNDSNRRYFEPAPARHWVLSLTARHLF